MHSRKVGPVHNTCVREADWCLHTCEMPNPSLTMKNRPPSLSWAGLPDFSWQNKPIRKIIYQPNIPISHKIYQNSNKIPNGLEIYQIFQPKSFRNTPKLAYLVWKYINHLATLVMSHTFVLADFTSANNVSFRGFRRISTIFLTFPLESHCTKYLAGGEKRLTKLAPSRSPYAHLLHCNKRGLRKLRHCRNFSWKSQLFCTCGVI
jgi:hypothetical protein